MTPDEGQSASGVIWLSGDGAAWARYDPRTGELTEGHARPRETSRDGLPDGWYRRLDGTFAAFYGHGGQAWLRIGDVTVTCSSPACLDWVRQANGMARVSLVDGDAIVASVVYFGGDAWGVPPELDFTMTEPEDFDFGEFVHRKLDDAENMRRIFGDGIEYDPGAVIPPTAKAILDALPPPTREVELGPLARLRSADLRAAPNPAPADRELHAFVSALDDAPELEHEEYETLGPPVMPLALGLTDREREALRLFAVRAAERVTPDGALAQLEPAVIAAVLGGLDCDAGSSSFLGAWRALDLVGDAAAELGVAPGELVLRAVARVGTLGEWRLLQWAEARGRRAGQAT